MNVKRWKTADSAVLKNNIKIATELGYSDNVIKKLSELLGDESAQMRVLHDARTGRIK